MELSRNFEDVASSVDVHELIFGCLLAGEIVVGGQVDDRLRPAFLSNAISGTEAIVEFGMGLAE